MAQGVHRHPLVDLGLLRRHAAGATELASGERVDRVLAGEEPAPGQHLAAGVGLPPPHAQQLEQGR